MISVVGIDGNVQEREHLKTVLASHPDIELCGIGKDGYDAVRLVDAYKPDVVMIDSKINEYTDADIPRLLKRISPSTAIVLMVSSTGPIPVRWIINGIPAACLLKDTDMGRLEQIIKEIYSGGQYINPTIAVKIFSLLAGRNKAAGNGRREEKEKSPSRLAGLSFTELQIFAYIAKGKSNNEIADCLNLKNGTIRNYISSAMKKTGLKNRIQIALYAKDNGLPDIYL
jgi:DNA-binding NarL/FixJ family response regulator